MSQNALMRRQRQQQQPLHCFATWRHAFKRPSVATNQLTAAVKRINPAQHRFALTSTSTTSVCHQNVLLSDSLRVLVTQHGRRPT